MSNCSQTCYSSPRRQSKQLRHVSELYIVEKPVETHVSIPSSISVLISANVLRTDASIWSCIEKSYPSICSQASSSAYNITCKLVRNLQTFQVVSERRTLLALYRSLTAEHSLDGAWVGCLILFTGFAFKAFSQLNCYEKGSIQLLGFPRYFNTSCLMLKKHVSLLWIIGLSIHMVLGWCTIASTRFEHSINGVATSNRIRRQKLAMKRTHPTGNAIDMTSKKVC